LRVFVDSSVFIYGLEFEESNSALIYNEIANGTVKAVINEKIIRGRQILPQKKRQTLCISN